jgi:hypothetical protein
MTTSVNPKMDWAEFSRRFKRHPAFMAVPIKEREPLFEEYVKEAKERDIRKKNEEVRTSKLAFVTLLQTLTPTALKLSWKKVRLIREIYFNFSIH